MNQPKRMMPKTCLNTYSIMDIISEYILLIIFAGQIMDEKISQKPHHLTLSNRNNGLITGVNDVISFDLNAILLETECGMLSIKGHDLHVNRLSVEKGEIEIQGIIDGMVYSDINTYAKKGESIFA